MAVATAFIRLRRQLLQLHGRCFMFRALSACGRRLGCSSLGGSLGGIQRCPPERPWMCESTSTCKESCASYGGRKSCTPGEWPANLPEIFEAASFAPASLSLRFGPRSYLSNNVSNCVFSWSGGTIPRHAKCRHWRTSALMAVGNGGRSNELCSPILGES
ncbi:unnamed protein product [Durusdinium trenchii]|uniref:Uncharacterized protein n=1 Tax=Durusdinium trenchii TaxID=1381693 RepID=A0ABP0QMB9_9DINO